ncbi:MAG: hypothetical protein K2X72_03625 [Reyranella sp.]|nr:hypothetical protein [Reyranella sp.]
MPLRRSIAAGLIGLLPMWGHAQAAGFVGSWKGDVPGVSAARLFITAVKPDGQVEGRMEFDLQSFVSTFGDKPNSTAGVSKGVVSGSVLVIDAALGGRYELTLSGASLTGFYTRGTTYKVPVTFTKA